MRSFGRSFGFQSPLSAHASAVVMSVVICESAGTRPADTTLSLMTMPGVCWIPYRMISFMSVTNSTCASIASCATACFASSSTLWQFAHPDPRTLIESMLTSGMSDRLWALDHTLRPQTATAGRKDVSQTVLLIRVQHLAATAETARGKRKPLHALAVRHIVGIVPQIAQVAFHDVSDQMT